MEVKTPYKLIGAAQSYFWGKRGITSRIARFPGVVASQEPLAEYWLGAHPRGAASVELASGERVAIADVLGGEAKLPFMLKVLSINSEFGLSIQSHPDAALAQRLHERDPKNYPDASHKPELGVALTPVTLAYGFKSFEALRAVAKFYPELDICWGKDLSRQIQEGCPSAEEALVQSAFSRLMRADSPDIARVVTAVVSRCSGADGAYDEARVMAHLLPRHGESDVGLLALLMFNLVTLQPGEGIFIGPNIPHAYLDGDLVECMACSDNVIRAGLTTKFKDVETLLTSVDYSRLGPPSKTIALRQPSGLAWYEVPAQEFSLGCIGSGFATIGTGAGASIALCLGGRSVVTHVDSKRSVSLVDGEAALLLSGSGSYECDVQKGNLFIACSGASL